MSSEYSLKKLKKEKQYKPKLILENDPIIVPSDVNKPLEAEGNVIKIKKKKKCDNCNGACGCDDYDEEVRGRSKKYY